MNHTNTYLYRPLLFPVVLVLLILGAAVLTYNWADEQAQQGLKQYQQKLSESDTLYKSVQQLQQRVDLVNTYYGQFQQLQQAGIIGDQSRVTWIDRFITLSRDYDVHHANLSFSPRQPLGTFDFRRLNSMAKLMQYESLDFEGDFQHEGDWFAFMTQLQQLHTMSVLDQCELTNLQKEAMMSVQAKDAFHFSADGGNIHVKCRVRFLLFKLPQKITKPQG